MTPTATREEVRDRRLRSPQFDERSLFQRYADLRDPDAQEQLVERYLPLARSLAKRYWRAEEPFEDLLQVASIGLLKAIDRFDLERGLAFSSFAVPTILGELRRHFRDRCWTVRPPRDLQERALEVERTIEAMSSRFGRTPSVRELGRALELQDEQVLEAMQALRAARGVSLDAPRAGGDGEVDTVADTIGTIDDGLQEAENRAVLKELEHCLSDRDREVLRLRFAEDLTQEQIGKIVGVSQMQVSRIIRQSIDRLRAAAEEEPVRGLPQ